MVYRCQWTPANQYLFDQKYILLNSPYNQFLFFPVGTTQTMLQRATVKTRVDEGCSSSDVCTEAKCPLHSSCVPLWEKYECKCHMGYVGSACKPVCEFNPCSNSGLCVPNKDHYRGYSCQCDEQLYTGEYCKMVNVLFVNPFFLIPIKGSGN